MTAYEYKEGNKNHWSLFDGGGWEERGAENIITGYWD